MIGSIRIPDPEPGVPEPVVVWMTGIIREVNAAIDDIRVQIQNYDITNVTDTRSFDAAAATLQQTKDTLGTLIKDMRGRSIVG